MKIERWHDHKMTNGILLEGGIEEMRLNRALSLFVKNFPKETSPIPYTQGCSH